MGLLRSELLRARSRRLVAMLIVGCVVAIAFSIVIVGLKSTKPSPEQVTEAKAAYEGCLSGRYLRPRGLIPSGYDSLADFCVRNNENDTGTGIFIGHLADV